jgi:ADP-heptose:LPS heptosyltransferase
MMIPEKVILYRWGGLGDVCMALCAAHALYQLGHRVHLVTHPDYHELARACPHVTAVSATLPNPRLGWSWMADLNAAFYGQANMHQVDAYLSGVGITNYWEVPASAKTLVLRRSHRVSVPMDRKLALLHAATGDRNRTWDGWAELASRLLDLGLHVACVGATTRDGRGAACFDGCWDLRDKLPHLGFVDLCKSASLLISTDSGPVQLAGATHIPILGLYTVVDGRYRLPFRDPTCRSVAVQASCLCSPCYRDMDTPAGQIALRQAIVEKGAKRAFGDWCPAGNGYQCGITVDAVYDAALELLKEKR